MTRLLLVAALLAGAVLLGAAVLLGRDPREPNLEVLPADMVRGPAAESGAGSGLFPDGAVQRLAPAGTIARGRMPLPFGPGAEEATRAGRELQNPVPDGEAVRKRGQEVFARACALCHGPTGRADAVATQRGVPPPPTLVRPESRAIPDGEVFHAITFGRKGMPPAALQVSREDRWKVIRWLRVLQEAK